MTFAHTTTRTTLAVITLLLGGEGLATSQARPPQHTPMSFVSKWENPGVKLHPQARFIQLPMAFEANGRQKAQRNDFLAQGPGYRLALSPREATFQLLKPFSSSQPAAGHKEAADETLTMQLVGADASAHAVQNAVPTGHANYFLGKDRSQWRTEIPLYSRVEYQQVYNGVDLVYYGNQHQLEYDFLVRPGTDPKRIALKFAGAQKVRIAANGDLVLGLKQDEVRWHKPLTYQMIAGKKHMVASSFVLKKGGEVGFQLARYDTSRALTIDPQLIYSTFLGGHNTSWAGALAVDSAGNTYVAGASNATDFPITSEAFQKTSKLDPTDPRYSNRATTFIAKVNSTGTAFLYATYLGGSGYDTPSSIAIDSQGNAYVTGSASSSDFPITPGAFQTVNLEDTVRLLENYSATSFVTKLNPTGSALIYSTYLGGHLGFSETDTTVAIAVDSQGSAYVTGIATSLDFPTTPGAFQTTVTTKGNGFITKLNPAGTALIYSTYLGNIGAECTAIAVDSTGSAYITGGTYSSEFPTTPGAFEPASSTPIQGECAFVTKLNPTGTALAYSTYLGNQSKGSAGYGIAVDSVGNAYVTGVVTPSGVPFTLNFPFTPGSFQHITPPQNALFPESDVFVAKFNAAGNALIYSACLGKGRVASIAIDGAGNASVAGTATGDDYPTTVGALKRVISIPANNSNTFVTRLNTTGTALLYSTFLPASQGDPSGFTIDSQGIATLCGGTYPQGFPTTPNAIQQSSDAVSGSISAFVTRFSAHPIFPDFNADGTTDMLLRNQATGVVGTWFLNGANVLGGATFSLIPPATFTLVGVGDFEANGIATLVFQNSTDNRIAFWNTGGANNAVITGTDYVHRTPDAGWNLVGVADFNQDGRSDLLFQNPTTGRLVIWNMIGLDFQSGVTNLPANAAGWKVVGTGDFNGDGFSDIVFQNQTTGQIALWYMNGSTYAGGTVLSTVPASGWKVVGAGDYNGDGKADLLLQNQTTNQIQIWYLHGGVYQGSSLLSQTPPADWKIVGPH